MQLNSVYLYPNKIDLFTNASADWKIERYRKVYNRNLKVYRSVDNRIDFQVRNSDEKAASIANTVLVFNLIARDGKDLILQKDCTLQSTSQGRAYVTLTKEELLDLNTGFYEFTIVQEQRSAIDDNNYRVVSRTPMYQDSQYGTFGVLEIVGDVLGDVEPSLTVNKFSYTNPFATGDENKNFYISSIINGLPQLSTPQSLHTFQMYFTNYSGEVIIQGSLDEDAAPDTWFDIETLNLTRADLEYRNITGKYNWFRVKHIPNSGNQTGSFVVQQTILGSYDVNIQDSGIGYSVGAVLTINGSNLGGETPTNNLVITVTSVSDNGNITGITWEGTSYNGVKTFVVSSTQITDGTFDKILYR
jgi:hypothetical protein